jgi:quinol monooxygenase YgiN
MFTRRVVFQLRADSSAEFTRIVEGDVLPVLRAQEGCRHEDTFISSRLSEAVLNSYWDTEARAEAYDRAGHQDALKALAGVLDGEPRVESFHVSSATYHTLTAARREAYRNSRFGRS